MIPLRDVIPSRTTPYITVAIIVVNALVFVFELRLPLTDRASFIEVYGIVPASVGSLSLLTSMFLHGGWLHFLGNMLYLWIFGDNVEDRVGHGRFIVFYLTCGLPPPSLRSSATRPRSSRSWARAAPLPASWVHTSCSFPDRGCSRSCPSSSSGN